MLRSIRFVLSSGRSRLKVEQVGTRAFRETSRLTILADIYCYACNDARLDPELKTHLATFGINVMSQKKTEKSMTELVMHFCRETYSETLMLPAANRTKLDVRFFSYRRGWKRFDTRLWPGHHGTQQSWKQVGTSFNERANEYAHRCFYSCYMASVLQMLFSLSPFQDRYYRRPSSDPSQDYVSEQAWTHWATCGQALPVDCLECQLFKLADGLLSGRYSHPHTEKRLFDSFELLQKADVQLAPSDPLAHPAPEHTPWQTGLKPTSLKTLVGKGHAEFATMRQQDAEEFFGHLLTVIRRYNHQAGGGAPGKRFRCTICMNGPSERYRRG